MSWFYQLTNLHFLPLFVKCTKLPRSKLPRIPLLKYLLDSVVMECTDFLMRRAGEGFVIANCSNKPLRSFLLRNMNARNKSRKSRNVKFEECVMELFLLSSDKVFPRQLVRRLCLYRVRKLVVHGWLWDRIVLSFGVWRVIWVSLIESVFTAWDTVCLFRVWGLGDRFVFLPGPEPACDDLGLGSCKLWTNNI